MDSDEFFPINGKMGADTTWESSGARPMRKLKILTAAGTLETFTINSIARLSGQTAKSVRYWVAVLLRRHYVRRSGLDRVSARGRPVIEYTWTSHGREAIKAEVLGSLPEDLSRYSRRTGHERSNDTELDLYDDPFASGLAVAQQWTVAAEEARDEEGVRKYLTLAGAEIRSLRTLLADKDTDQVRDCEMLARRLERLSQRAPIEAYRSRIKAGFKDALANAMEALGGGIAAQPDFDRLLDEELALVLNATKRQENTARVVGEAVGMVGRSYFVFEMAQATANKRRQAIEALGPLFTGPGSAAVKLFIVIDSRDGQKSFQVMDDLVKLFGDSSHVGDLMAANRSYIADHGTWATSLPILVMGATSMPSDDWLPRGLAKQALLQAWVRDNPSIAPEMARVTLNDPVIFDCSGPSIHDPVTNDGLWSKFSYHRVALNEAVVQGLVIGSFNGISEVASPHISPSQVPEARTLHSTKSNAH